MLVLERSVALLDLFIKKLRLVPAGLSVFGVF
jgi:hypothetical protein